MAKFDVRPPGPYGRDGHRETPIDASRRLSASGVEKTRRHDGSRWLTPAGWSFGPAFAIAMIKVRAALVLWLPAPASGRVFVGWTFVL